MKAQSIVLTIAGTFFGFIVGWILGTQQAGVSRGVAVAPVAATQQAAAPASNTKVVDESQAAPLRAAVQSNPSDEQSRVQLGNLYFDAERYDEAAKWYEEAVRLNPKDINVSTDLAVSYYYQNQIDRALQQFDHSLALDSKHLKTLLNRGIVLAFGKQDLEAAAASWQKVISLSPDSQEGQAAKRLLDNLKSAHPGGTAAPASTPRG
ncbi:MAG: tetratricopeptide repeat protein [Bacteroidales bacterium]